MDLSEIWRRLPSDREGKVSVALVSFFSTTTTSTAVVSPPNDPSIAWGYAADKSPLSSLLNLSQAARQNTVSSHSP